MPATEKLAFPSPVVVCDEELKTQTLYCRAVRTITYPADATTEDQMSVIEASGALDFWNDPAEDIYSEKHGDAI